MAGNETDVKSEVRTEGQPREEMKESVKCETEGTCKEEGSEFKSEVKQDETIDVSEVTTADSAVIDNNFSVSEALISRTLYPRVAKPYSKLDTFLDRRLMQFSAEQKQRALCEQLIAGYRVRQAVKKVAPASDKLSEAQTDVAAEVGDTLGCESLSKGSPAPSSSHCYSSLCCSTSGPPNTACYSCVCRQRNSAAKPPAAINRQIDSVFEDSKEAAAEPISANAVKVSDTAAAESAGPDVRLPKAENNRVPSVVDSVSVKSVPNCISAATKSHSRVSRKRAGAVIAGRNRPVASAVKVAPPSLSLEKYAQDGKVSLTAEMVAEIEEALATCGQTRHKVTLVRRVGPGRPPTKSSSRLSASSQRKPTLPPAHRFMSGRSSRRSLFALERHFLTVLARREGRWECPGFNYACKMTNVGWPYPCPRPFFFTAWRYRTQTLQNIAAAAVQLRVLWACIRWDDIKAHVPPGGTNTVTTDLDICTTELLKKRDLPPYCLRSEYLVRKIVVPISVPTSQSRGELLRM